MKSYNLKMDLQLFADPSASLQNTTGTMTNEMKTFYEKRLIDQAEPRLVHDQFADYYPVPQNGGKTIEFRKYDSLPKADTPLTEGVTPNGQTHRTGSVLPDLRLAGLDEADVAQLADLAAVHGVGVGVLVGLDELLAGLEVVGGVGMDDGDVAVADGVSVHRAQLCRRLEEQLRGQGAALVQRLAAGDGSLGAVCGKLRRIDDVGAAGQYIAGDAVHGAARLACQNAGVAICPRVILFSSVTTSLRTRCVMLQKRNRIQAPLISALM